MAIYKNDRIVEGKKSLTGFMAAGNMSTIEVFIWALFMMPPYVATCGAGVCWMLIGLFAGGVIGWLFCSKELKKHADNSDASINSFTTYAADKYHSMGLNILLTIIWMVALFIILAALVSYLAVHVEETFSIRKEIVVLVCPTVISLIMMFVGNRVKYVIKNIVYILFVAMIIILIIFLFVRKSPSEILDAYGRARLEEGTSIYLDIMYRSGKPLGACDIVSMVGMGLGCLGLPFLYKGVFGVKNLQELDRGRILSITFQGIIIVSASVWSLLVLPVIYPLHIGAFSSTWDLLDVFLLSEYNGLFYGNILRKTVMLLFLLLLFCVSEALFEAIVELAAGDIKIKKTSKKIRYGYLIDVFLIVVIALGLIIYCILSDINIEKNIFFVWKFMCGIAVPCIWVVASRYMPKAGIYAGILFSIAMVSFCEWVRLPFGLTICEFTGMNAGVISFLTTLVFMFLIRLFVTVQSQENL